MLNQKASQAVAKAVEANAEICRTYQREFESRIADSNYQPEGSRISELEQLWRKARTDAELSYSKLTEELIGSIDENEVIESKKANTLQRG